MPILHTACSALPATRHKTSDPTAQGRCQELAADRPAEGGPRLASLFTVVENSPLAGVDPEAYLVDLIDRLPDHPMKRIAELLSHAWKNARTAAPAVITSLAVVA